jgi:hypothetical protein
VRIVCVGKWVALGETNRQADGVVPDARPRRFWLRLDPDNPYTQTNKEDRILQNVTREAPVALNFSTGPLPRRRAVGFLRAEEFDAG